MKKIIINVMLSLSLILTSIVVIPILAENENKVINNIDIDVESKEKEAVNPDSLDNETLLNEEPTSTGKTSVNSDIEAIPMDTQNTNNIIQGTWGTASFDYNEDTRTLTVYDGTIFGGLDVDKPIGIDSRQVEHIVLGDNVIFDANASLIFSSSVFSNGLKTITGSTPDTSNVTDMSGMFYNSSSLTEVDVSNWDTSNVVNMENMFSYTPLLTEIDVSNWDTSNVVNMQNMFSYAPSLTEIDVSNWDTSNVTDMSIMFYDTRSLKELDVSNWNTSNVTNMSAMFARASSLTELDVSNWNTSNVTDMSVMFSDSSSLTELDVSNWNTSNVTDMSGMFYNSSSLTEIDVSNWNTSNVTDMSGMFYDTSSLKELDVSNWNTSNVTKMNFTFSRTPSLSQVDVSNWNTSNVIFMNNMFARASSLTEIDVSKWNTSNVTDMSSMFAETKSLTEIDLSSFDTSKVTNMNSMFTESSLNKLDLSNFNTDNVTNMAYMFSQMPSLIELNLSNFNTSKVTDMRAMYMDTKNLSKIHLGNKSIFNNLVHLPEIRTLNTEYTGRWINEDTHNIYPSSEDFMTNYDGTITGIHVWEVVEKYTITYNLNGGTNDATNPSNYTYGVGVASFAPATKEGYTFIEWQDESGNVITSITETDLGDKVLNAVFEKTIIPETPKEDIQSQGTTTEGTPNSNEDKLPQTGISTNSVYLALLLVIIGSIAIRVSKKRRKNNG